MEKIVLEDQKNRLLIRKGFEIMIRSCRLCKDKSLFFERFAGEKINDIRIYKSGIDREYEYYGNINGKSTYFNISDENYHFNFRIFIENVGGLSKYASCGLQKVKETDDTSIYYHILNGKILSEVECRKSSNFLKELNSFKEIKPFVIKKTK